ncbi:recombinase RecA [Methanococcoides methylutens]|uniref:Recombinase RecA n=1 Tax=Methanococcoides methylutens TaxID=2226 RepID=A0A099T0V1_METMT|nr:ATPase domain-containing protein [Methanococcoides methylutens]KGK98782.1 recombinase RecA [Methanococcoides methylutens]
MSSQLSVGTEVIITPRTSQHKVAAEPELSLTEDAHVQRKVELRTVTKETAPVTETKAVGEIPVKNEVRGVQKNVCNGPVVVPTGIYVLDRTLGGGLPLNSMVYFSADPRSMSEVFFYEFTQSRKTYYFTTGRRPKYVRQDIMNQNLDTSNIIFVDIYSEYYFTSMGDMVDNLGNRHIDSKIIEYAEYNLHTILNDSQGEEINIIFDNFSFFMNLNVNPGLLKRLLNLLYETTKEANSITFLYSLKGSHDERAENEILNASDVIFDVDVEKHPDKLMSKLSIPKIRGMAPETDVIKFNVSEGINIDTSKDIA